MCRIQMCDAHTEIFQQCYAKYQHSLNRAGPIKLVGRNQLVYKLYLVTFYGKREVDAYLTIS